MPARLSFRRPSQSARFDPHKQQIQRLSAGRFVPFSLICVSSANLVYRDYGQRNADRRKLVSDFGGICLFL
jgi:hypothetical protein